MIAISTLFLCIVLSVCNGKPIFKQTCPDDAIHFATKVENSSIVVYGKTTGKVLYPESDAMFFVLFQVDCVLKGPAIARHINITQAGQVKGKTYCQDFPFGRGYTIAFLERNPLNVNDSTIFIPSDFVEVPFEGNSTSELLTDTCNLHQLLPLNSSVSITDVCPNVSTGSQCVNTRIRTNELTSTGSGLTPNVIPGGFQHGTDDIRSKSGTIQVDVDTKNGINSINISILLIVMAIFFGRLN